MVKSFKKITFPVLLTISCLAMIIPDIIEAAEPLKTPVRFAVLGDRTGTAAPGIYERIVGEIQLLRPDFVITVGDMIEGPAVDSTVINERWREYFELVKPLSMPLYFTPGNNDIYSDLSYDLYLNNIGPSYYSFDQGDLHFIILDNSRIESSEEFPPEQLTWLVADLQNNREAAKTFVVMHKPFWNETTAEGKPDTLHSLFVEFGVDEVFCGHYHEYFSGEFDGVKYTTFGSSGGSVSPSPNGLEYHYGWVTVDSAGVHLAVLNLGSALPRNVTTVAERKTYRHLRRKGLSFDSPLPVAPDLTVKTIQGEVTIHNIFCDFSLNDTLQWDIPEGWTITPAVMPVSYPAHVSGKYNFTATCTGPLYPVPTALLKFTYGKNKKVEVTKSLAVSRTAYCNQADESVRIDGRLDEAFWSDPVGTLFSENGEPATTDPSEFYFAYDKDNLYLAARLTDRKIDSLTARVTEHDGPVYTEDCIGYFISPHEYRDTIFQLYFNFLGTAYDNKIWVRPDNEMGYDRAFNREYETRAVKDNDSWTIEIRVPVSVMGLAEINQGDKWTVNFRRKQPRLSAAADWQVPIGYPDYQGGCLLMW